MNDRPQTFFWVTLLVIGVLVGIGLLSLLWRLGGAAIISRESSPLPLPTSSLDFGKLKFVTFPPPLTLPPDLQP